MINVEINAEFPVEVWDIIVNCIGYVLEGFENEIAQDQIFNAYCEEFEADPSPRKVLQDVVAEIKEGYSETAESEISISLCIFYWYLIRCVLELSAKCYEMDSDIDWKTREDLIFTMEIIINNVDQYLDNSEQIY